MTPYRQLPLWGPLASIAMGLAWLLPNAHHPWVGFHKDAYLGIVLSLLGLVVFAQAARRRTSVEIPPLALMLVGMGALVWIQYSLGLQKFFGEAFVGSLYLWGAALSLVCGLAWERAEPGAAARFVFFAFALASMASMGIMLVQWLDVASSSIWFSRLPGNGRVVGNLNQPNNAATLLVWGLVSLFWLRATGRIANVVWFIAAAPLLGCLVLTGSRINYLSCTLMLLVGSYCAWRAQGLKSYRAPLVCLLSLFIGFLLLQGLFGAHPTEANPFERQFAGARMLAYKSLSVAVLEKPWLGYGFNQTIYAQIAAREMGYPLPALFTWAHNIFLDIAVWFGLPILLLTVVLVLRLALQLRFMNMNPDRLAMLLILMAFGAHAMVELPHAYAIFLLPIALVLGVLIGTTTSLGVVRIRAWAVCLVFLGVIAIFSITLLDYFKVEKSYYDWRFKVQRVGTHHPMSVPNVLALDQFQALIRGFRSADQALSEAELQAFRQSVLYYPSPYALQHLAILQVQAGRPIDARETIGIAQSVLSPGDFADMVKQWRQLQKVSPILNGVDWAESQQMPSASRD